MASKCMNNESKFKNEYTKAVRTGILNLEQKEIKDLDSGIFKLHEFVPDDNGWWELLVPHTLLLTHNEITNLLAPYDSNWNDSWKELKFLNISYNQVSEIPIEILKLEFLRKLIFHHNKIENISFIINSSHNLQHIELQNNNLESLDSNIGELINLKYLNISHNKLLSLPQSLSKCIKLEVFEVTNNNINGDNLNNIDFSTFLYLKQFDISFNKITSIPSSLFYLPSLYRLSATQNKINKIYINIDDEKEKEIKQNSYLIDLYLGNNNLSQFPFDKIKLNSLKLLDLKGNKFNEINKNIYECCRNLERFDISNNNLQDIPAQISMIENIKSLIVTGNPLKRINKSVINDSYLLINYLRKKLIPSTNKKEEELENIKNAMNKLNINGKELKLNKKNLISLPLNICKMINLCHLELDDNKLNDISDLKYCKNLKYLSLRKNNIQNIHCLFDLDKLNVIDLRINKLKKIQYHHNKESISIWPNLHCLRIGHNQINDEISEFLKYINSSNINIFDISNNNITIFPKSILNWKLLQVLDLSNNHLSNIPFQLGLMPKLNTLILSGNKLRKMTSIINTGNTQKILKWLRNRIE